MNMKREDLVRSAVLVALAATLLPMLAGCAAIRRQEAADAERMLGAAGFKPMSADTPERATALQTMKPLQLKSVSRNGQTYYVYPDPYGCKCLWVGGADEFKEYQRLRFEKRMEDEDLAAAEADEDAALMNSEVWGPWWYAY
jgi:hypothetical protein